MVGIKSENHKLTYKINLSYSTTTCNDKTWIPAWIQSNRVYLAKENERLTKAHRKYTDALIENTLTWDGTMGLHHANIVVGQTFQQENTNTLSATGVNLSQPYFLQLQNASDWSADSYEYKHTFETHILPV